MTSLCHNEWNILEHIMFITAVVFLQSYITNMNDTYLFRTLYVQLTDSESITARHTPGKETPFSNIYLKWYIITHPCTNCNGGLIKPQLKISFVYLDVITNPFPNLEAGPIFTKWRDVLPQDLVKSRSREIGCCNNPVALKFDRHLGSDAAESPVKFQSDWKSLNPNLAASRRYDILR